MKNNLGKTDKYIRMMLGIMAILAGVHYQSWWGALGLVLIVTAFINWCPIYALFGINSCSYNN